MTKVAIQSIVGTRESQEDSAFANTYTQGTFAVVCDGMGGHSCGKLASELTIRKLKDLYEKKEPTETFPAFYLKAVDILDEQIFTLKSEFGEKLGAGTTLVAASIEHNELFWLSVGDSRLYILRNNELVQATRDHNYFLKLDQMKAENEINEDEYNAAAAKGEALISFIGMGGIEIMDINYAPFTLVSGDVILLATDGLYKALSAKEILDCLQVKDIRRAAGTLMNSVVAKAHLHQDNTTCIIIKYELEGIK